MRKSLTTALLALALGSLTFASGCALAAGAAAGAGAGYIAGQEGAEDEIHHD